MTLLPPKQQHQSTEGTKGEGTEGEKEREGRSGESREREWKGGENCMSYSFNNSKHNNKYAVYVIQKQTMSGIGI